MPESNSVILTGFTRSELEEYLLEHGFKRYNAGQIFEWIYQKQEKDFSLMSNLSLALREHLIQHCQIPVPGITREQISADGTHKFLLELDDNALIETVLMRHDYGLSLCVTSQIGCSMGCAFCASGLKKRQRNLTVAELVGQIMAVSLALNVRISHVVVMGTGEPFDNYDHVIRFIRTINDDKGLAIGQRHITVSTCGIVPKILQYADEPIRSNLAISLHASNDSLRSRLMPINRRYPLSDIISACEVYFAKTSRRVTYEYILLAGVNDSLEQANELADLLRGQNAYVNLIPYNPVGEFTFKQTNNAQALAFLDRLSKRGINAILRKEQGADIQAACGQLRLHSGDG